jgi:hypothetical protein
MRKQLLVLGFSALPLFACGAAPEQQLKDSFVQQIASSGIVHDLQQKDDDVLFTAKYGLFTAKYGERPDAKWRVHVDSTSIEPDTDGTTPHKGVVKSSWSVNGEPIRPRGDQSDLPLAFLDKGIAQECWAFWDKSQHQSSWK